MPSVDAVYTLEQVASHSTAGDCWIVVDGLVLDVSKFAKYHPAGQQIILDVAGKDASAQFWQYHRKEILDKYVPRLCIGKLEKAPATKQRVKQRPFPAAVQPASPLLSSILHAENPSCQGFDSPYYKESHLNLRVYVRKWLQEHIVPNINGWLAKDKPVPKEVFKKMGQAGILAANLGPGSHLTGLPLPNGLQPEEFDFFHEQIVHEEIYRLGCKLLSRGFSPDTIV